MKLSEKRIALLKSNRVEGFRSKAYKPIPTDPWTIGYGFTKGVKEGDTITREEADRRFPEIVAEFEDSVNGALTLKPNQNQFDACVLLAYNIGAYAFPKSAIAKFHNAGNFIAASNAFKLYNKSKGKVLKALVSRRAMEAAMYLEPVDNLEVVMPQAVDEPKPLSQSSINRASVIGGGTAAIATVTEIAKSVGDLKSSVDGLGTWWPVPALLIVTIVACGWLIWKRWQLREEGRL